MEFSRKEYWSGLSFPSPQDFHDRGIKPLSPALQVDSSVSEPPGKNCTSFCLWLLAAEPGKRSPLWLLVICPGRATLCVLTSSKESDGGPPQNF